MALIIDPDLLSQGGATNSAGVSFGAPAVGLGVGLVALVGRKGKR
jgi:hypothetical protein